MVNNFESNTQRLLRVKSLYYFDKWEQPWWNRSSHDPKYKDHRRGQYDFRSKKAKL